MLPRLRSLLSVGVCLAGAVLAQASPPGSWLPGSPGKEPGRSGTDVSQQAPAASQPTNQQLADEIVQRLRQSPRLKGYHVDVVVYHGSVQLSGYVSDQSQRDEILNLTRRVSGVVQIQDRLVLTNPGGITQTQALDPIPGPPPRKEGAGPLLGDPPASPATGGAAMPPEPTNLLQGAQQGAQPGPAVNAYTQPRMPPYAWPTYAPYNNYSRVAYPLLYPYQSWPFIGPMYPFPKIPPGWRSIHLTWEDGYWWYGRNSRGHDWWRVRFW